jgi:tripartite-type tricarboxylate transporter receptor subunit TctC
VNASHIRELIALAKSKPGVLNYATTGVGGPSFMAAALFSERAGIRMTNIPYKGGGPAANAILAGEVHMVFLSIVAALPHARAGRLRGLAVTGPRRATVAPDIPTVAEAGFPGFEVTTWYGLFLPGRSPDRIATALDAAAAKALAMPDVVEAITRQGAEVSYKGRKEFAEHIKRETAMWAQLIREAGIKGE